MLASDPGNVVVPGQHRVPAVPVAGGDAALLAQPPVRANRVGGVLGRMVVEGLVCAIRTPCARCPGLAAAGPGTVRGMSNLFDVDVMSNPASALSTSRRAYAWQVPRCYLVLAGRMLTPSDVR